MTGAEVEEVLDGVRADRAYLRRGRASTGSSCTAPTATCSSSPSAPGATGVTTSGASRWPSSRRLILARCARESAASRSSACGSRPRTSCRPSAAASARTGSAGIARALVDTGDARLRQPVGGLAHGALRARRSAATATRSASSCRSRPRLREEIGGRVPVIAASRINDPEHGRAGARAGDCDLVAMTRAQIADPDLRRQGARAAAADPALRRREPGLRRPDGRRPADHLLPQSRTSAARSGASPSLPLEARNVLVVGGGPAGLQGGWRSPRAAGTASRWSSGSRELGGRLRPCARLGDAARAVPGGRVARARAGRPRGRHPQRRRGRRGGPRRSRCRRARDRRTACARPDRRGRRLDPGALDRRGGGAGRHRGPRTR